MYTHSRSTGIRIGPMLAGLLAHSILLAPSLAAQSGYRIVINDENPTTSLSKAEIGKIFLGKVATWPDGEVARPVDRAPDDEVREVFSKDIHDRNVSSIKAYWQRQIFSGRGTPPSELGSDQDVLDYVRDHPGGIGYVEEGASLGSGVKVLRIEQGPAQRSD